MNKHKVFYFIIGLISLISLIIWRNEALSFLKDYGGAIGLFLGVVSPIFSFVYMRNERCYLFIQRNIFLPFRNIDTRWKLIIPCSPARGTTQDEWNRFFDNITKSYMAEVDGAVIRGRLLNQLEIMVKDEVIHKFYVDDNDKLWFTTSTFTVPSYDNDETIDYYQELLELITQEDLIKNYQCQLALSFEGNNPYFGYFVRHIPYKSISAFSCIIDTAKPNGVKIEVTKSKVVINGSNMISVGNYARKCMAFSENLITG